MNNATNERIEHYCPACGGWTSSTVHAPGEHLGEGRPDDRLRVTTSDGRTTVYESEEELPERLRLALPW